MRPDFAGLEREKVITAKEREALELHFHPRRPLGYRAIALALGISVPTVRDRLKRALQKIDLHERRAA